MVQIQLTITAIISSSRWQELENKINENGMMELSSADMYH